MQRWLLAGIFFFLFCFFYFGFYRYFSFSVLKHYQSVITLWTENHAILSVGLFILLLTFLIACAIPCATFLTLTGGFLFGPPAILYSLFGITIGGMILFLVVRSAIGSRLKFQSKGWVSKIEQGFKKNAFHYLMALRLVPVFPCWISNVGAGLFNLRISTFLTATCLGILPSTIIYVYAGRSLGKILSENTPVSHLLLTPSILLPLMGLAILSLMPVIYNTLKADRKDEQA